MSEVKGDGSVKFPSVEQVVADLRALLPVDGPRGVDDAYPAGAPHLVIYPSEGVGISEREANGVVAKYQLALHDLENRLSRLQAVTERGRALGASANEEQVLSQASSTEEFALARLAIDELAERTGVIALFREAVSYRRSLIDYYDTHYERYVEHRTEHYLSERLSSAANVTARAIELSETDGMDEGAYRDYIESVARASALGKLIHGRHSVITSKRYEAGEVEREQSRFEELSAGVVLQRIRSADGPARQALEALYDYVLAEHERWQGRAEDHRAQTGVAAQQRRTAQQREEAQNAEWRRLYQTAVRVIVSEEQAKAQALRLNLTIPEASSRG